MRLPTRIALVLGALSVLPPAAAHAVEFGFTCVTSNSPANCLAGAAQFTLAVEEGAGGRVKFVFRNLGPEPSSIAQIYFDGAPTLESIYKIVSSPGTDFTVGGDPSNLPGGNSAVPPFGADFVVSATNPQAFGGINPGERLKVLFTLAYGKSFDDVLVAMAAGGVRVGMHTIAWADGQSDSFLTGPPVTSVPEPPAIALFGGALLLTANLLRRRWRRRTV